MKVLLVHNYYRQAGGEDAVFHNEGELLETHGDTVIRYSRHNDELMNCGLFKLAVRTAWNKAVYQELRSIIHQERPKIVHFHNTFPLISPAGYYAAKREGVPVIQTLHNFRLFCPNGLLFREGRVCEDCRGRLPWPGVARACYRSSRAATGAAAAMLTLHRLIGTWAHMVDMYIALTEFGRNRFIEGGLPPEKIVVKPNCLSADLEIGNGAGKHAIFIGRLSPEKGIKTVLQAWKQLGKLVPLKVVGDGPLAPALAQAAEQITGVEWLGRMKPDDVYALIGQARFLIFPSECYETFGMVVIESFAKGKPVIAAKIGAIPEVVKDGATGLLFEAGNAEDLRSKVIWAAEHPEEMLQMGKNARRVYEEKYTAGKNYEMLTDIYLKVTKQK